jgi:hypothetical protein
MYDFTHDNNHLYSTFNLNLKKMKYRMNQPIYKRTIGIPQGILII